MSFKIITDAASDLPDGYAEAHDIPVNPYFVSFDDEHYLTMGVDITVDEFYERMATEKVFPKTSQPLYVDYERILRPYAMDGTPTIIISMSSKFSGAYSTLATVVDALNEEFPKAELYAIDSLCASVTQSLLIMEIVRMRDNGLSAKEAAETIERLKTWSSIYVTVDTLEYLQRGGRIGKAAALAGTILGIKPIIRMYDGELFPVSKVRGRKKAVAQTIHMTMEYVGEHKEDFNFSIITSSKAEENEAMKLTLKNDYDIDIVQTCKIGITIGVHIGLTVIGVAALKKYDRL